MKFIKGFYYAGRGIAEAIKERNFRFHLCIMAYALYFSGKFYSFSAEKWAILLLTCGAVLSIEAANTAIERLCDRVTTQSDPLIQKTKDCAAGAVLISAVIAVIVGVLLFGNKDIFSLIFLFFSEPLRMIALILSVVISWCFVFLPELLNKFKE